MPDPMAVAATALTVPIPMAVATVAPIAAEAPVTPNTIGITAAAGIMQTPCCKLCRSCRLHPVLCWS